MWRTEDKRPSISSEESLSDYEEAGNLAGSLGFTAAADRVDTIAAAQIWDFKEIQAGLR